MRLIFAGAALMRSAIVIEKMGLPVHPIARYGLGGAIFTFILDQVTKLWMLYGLDLSGRRVQVLPFFDLVLVWNDGVSYGLFAGGGVYARLALILFALAAIVVLLYWLWKASHWIAASGLALIIGGAFGNLVDRLIHGAVVDFVLLHGFGYSWYVFNLADAAIVVGCVLLLYDWLGKGHRTV